jgi:geranylgeranyl pyrophosphate synthase
VEYFHIASLALDDLPCMDDARERRGEPCVHRQHGEAAAILAALALINRAYLLVHAAFAGQAGPVRLAAAVCVDHCLGPAGLVGGQARDLAFGRSDRSAREIGRTALAKSGALFGLAVMLPTLARQPEPREMRDLRALCLYWGLAFQLVDDLRDVLSTSAVEGKTTGRDRALGRPNLVLALGLAAARARLVRLRHLADQTLARLAPRGGGRWRFLVTFQAEALAALADNPARSAA